ncbi:hypothetical protein C8J57DRAFT_955326, partial [Mycena rebaudengoi]
QPTRRSREIACLTAELDIGGSKAYVLFDTGSNIDSLTPEYARATQSPLIRLDEQVTLQLGCVGSRSKISFGTRTPVSFGGIRGHIYCDIANLDRYDGIIGTPFMNKHGLILDFGKREVRFPNGHVVKALSAVEESSLVTSRSEVRSDTPRVSLPSN